MNKQLRVHQQNFKDASYQNSNYSLSTTMDRFYLNYIIF